MTDRVPLYFAETDLSTTQIQTPLGTVAIVLPPHLRVRKPIFKHGGPSIYPVLIVELEERHEPQ